MGRFNATPPSSAGCRKKWARAPDRGGPFAQNLRVTPHRPAFGWRGRPPAASSIQSAHQVIVWSTRSTRSCAVFGWRLQLVTDEVIQDPVGTRLGRVEIDQVAHVFIALRDAPGVLPFRTGLNFAWDWHTCAFNQVWLVPLSHRLSDPPDHPGAVPHKELAKVDRPEMKTYWVEQPQAWSSRGTNGVSNVMTP